MLNCPPFIYPSELKPFFLAIGVSENELIGENEIKNLSYPELLNFLIVTCENKQHRKYASIPILPIVGSDSFMVNHEEVFICNFECDLIGIAESCPGISILNIEFDKLSRIELLTDKCTILDREQFSLTNKIAEKSDSSISANSQKKNIQEISKHYVITEISKKYPGCVVTIDQSYILIDTKEESFAIKVKNLKAMSHTKDLPCQLPKKYDRQLHLISDLSVPRPLHYIVSDDFETSIFDEKANEDFPSFCSYKPSDKILLVGEGNFSFSAALCKMLNFPGKNFVASSQNFPQFKSNYQLIESVGSEVILLDVSGANLEPLKGKKDFDNLIFNFPHTGVRQTSVPREQIQESIKSNQLLLRNLFVFAKHVISEYGRVHLTIKNVLPYTAWNLLEIAEDCGFLCVRKFSFPWREYTEKGYTHATTMNLSKSVQVNLEAAITYEFQILR